MTYLDASSNRMTYLDVPIYLHLRTWLFKLHLYFQTNRIIHAVTTVKSVHNKILNSYIYFWFNFSQQQFKHLRDAVVEKINNCSSMAILTNYYNQPGKREE